MSKITRQEYLDNIRNIINEGMSDTPDQLGTNRFNITKYISNLIEEAHRDPKLMDYLMRWNNGLKTIESGTEYRSYRQFAEGLAQFQKGNIAVKNVISEINECLKAHGAELDVYCAIDTLSDPIAADAVREAYNDYLFEPSEDNHKALVESLWPAFSMNESGAVKIMTILSDESVVKTEVTGYLNEQADANENINKILAKQREEKKIKRVKEKLEAYVEEVFEKASIKAQLKEEHDKQVYSFAGLANNNNIGLSEAIKTIAASDARKNHKLMETIDQYAGALNTGLYEERLYETFLRNMQAYTYLRPVEKAIKLVNENVSKNRVSIEITKLLEEMSESSSWQILPLIEEDCARYAKNPNPTNRVQLRNCLMQFATDPYCYKILETVDRDNSKEANTLTERAVSIKDAVKLIRSHAETSAIYSPVQFIKEGECVFNANGTYYVKKNNSISKLNHELVNQLSEKFVTLCKLTNDPHVTINDDCIILTGNDKVAEIHEAYVNINGTKESQSTLRNLNEMCVKYDFDTNFFIMCSCLLENFNNIAKLNFGTHIALKENLGINVDMFRLGDQIFINTVNEDTQTSTFYHNVNPLQCKNIINGHMGLNVSSLFESLLPSQDKILMRLNETQDAYIESINKLESTIDKLEKEKEKHNDENTVKKLEDGIKVAKDKLKEIKDEYKDWQKKVEDETGEDMGASESDDEDDVNIDDDEVNGDGDTRKETTAEPLEDDEVEDEMAELTQPIGPGNKESGEDFNLTDDEFETYLTGDDSTSDDSDDVVTPDDSDDTLPADDIDFNDVDLDDNSDENDSDDSDSDDVDDSDENVSDKIIDITGEVDDMDSDDTDDSDAMDSTDALVNNATEEIFADENDSDDVDEILTDTEQEVETPDATELSDDEILTGDEGFDEVTDDELTVETPAEDVPSDEDVLLPDPEEATDVFGGDVKDPLDTNKTVEDIDTSLDSKVVQDMGNESIITKVLFDENIKTGEKYRSGKVSVITPMISSEGELYDKLSDYKFYLNDEGLPVIDGDDMSATLYKGIVSKIQAEPNYSVFVEQGIDRLKEDETKKLDTIPDEKLDYTKVITPANDEDLLPEPENIPEENVYKVTDLPDEFKIEADFDDGDDNEELTDILPDDEPKDFPFIPTYLSGETEIELPAPTVDDSIIPESKQNSHKKSVNENRKAIKGITSKVKSKSGSNFFVNEGTVKPSKNEAMKSNVNSMQKFDGVAFKHSSLIENYNPESEIIEKLHWYADRLTKKAAAQTGDILEVSNIDNYLFIPDVQEIYKPLYFSITKTNSEDLEHYSYTIYHTDSGVYYRPTYEFKQIIKDLDKEVPEQTITALTYGYTDEHIIEPLNVETPEDCEFVIKAIIQSLVGTLIKDDELFEKVKIRKTKLSAGHDFEKSKLADDIQHGDKEERDFKADVEKDTKAAGIDNPLAPSQPAQEEAYNPILPNAHRKMNISEMKELYDFIYESDDYVIYNRIKAKVVNVSEDGTYAEIMLLTDGQKIQVQTKDLEPDPEYINDLNASDEERKSLKPETPDSSKDLDAHTIECNIMVDGQQLNIAECFANLADIKNSKHKIRVMNETGIIDEYSPENIEFLDLPYACVINAEGEPVRKIQIYPDSYINAEPDDLVRCICGGKETTFPKRVINILS